MSRSRKKSIIVDKLVGPRKYWRTIRREHKSYLKHYQNSAKKISFHAWLYSEDEEFKKFNNFFLDKGMDEEEAYYKAVWVVEDDLCFGNRMAGNLWRDWFDEPEFRDPKLIINDWDYKDDIWDYEYTLKYEYYFDHITREWDTEEHDLLIKKLKRK